MLPKVLAAYEEAGFHVDLGNPGRVFSTIQDMNRRDTLSVSGGFTPTDALLFIQIAKAFSPAAVFVIGNSFGLSTFVLAELFPNAVVDAIDAEVEGLEGRRGTEISRRIAERHFRNVQVTVGFSPQDIGRAVRASSYNLVFVDGLHTNEQMILDFDGISPYCGEECVIVFHDVGYAKMISGWTEVLRKAGPMGFEGFSIAYTQLGTCVLARNAPALSSYLKMLSGDFCGPYNTGFTDDSSPAYPRRPFFWDMSFSHLEKLVRRKLRRVFVRSRAT